MIATLLLAPGLTAAAQGTAASRKSGSTAETPPASSRKTSETNRGAKTPPVVYRKVETTNYIIEVPKNWEVGEETPFGQREIHPGKETAKTKPAEPAGETDKSAAKSSEKGDPKGQEAEKEAAMSSMTGPGLGKQGWDQLYKTSLFYITRFGAGSTSQLKPTAYVIGKSRQGFETCSWTMNDSEKHPQQRFVILKHTNDNILALSVKLPPAASKDSKERLESIFQHMVDTAVVR